MRSYKVFGHKDGEATYVTTVHTPEEGKTAHNRMRTEGHYDEISVRDALGGAVFRYNLRTGEKIH